jgi:hypothetical protein
MSGFFKIQLFILLFPCISFSQKKFKHFLKLADEDVKYLEVSARRVNANLFKGSYEPCLPASSLDLTLTRVFRIEGNFSPNAAIGWGLNYRAIQNGTKALGLSTKIYGNDAFGVQNLGIFIEWTLPIVRNRRSSKIEMVNFLSKDTFSEGFFGGLGIYYIIAENHLIDLTLNPVAPDFFGKMGGSLQYTYRIPYTRGKRYLAKKAKKCPDLR